MKKTRLGPRSGKFGLQPRHFSKSGRFGFAVYTPTSYPPDKGGSRGVGGIKGRVFANAEIQCKESVSSSNRTGSYARALKTSKTSSVA